MTLRAEAGETKGVVVLHLDEGGLVRHEFRQLPDHPPPPPVLPRSPSAAAAG